MKMTTVRVMEDSTGKLRYGVAVMGSNWPIALCGPAEGGAAVQAKKEAEFLAAGTAMFDMLELLANEFQWIDPKIPLSAEKMDLLSSLASRSKALVDKHRFVKF